jgi:hypothetical protein
VEGDIVDNLENFFAQRPATTYKQLFTGFFQNSEVKGFLPNSEVKGDMQQNF